LSAFICTINETLEESMQSSVMPIPPRRFHPEKKDFKYGKPPKSIIEAVRKELKKLLDAPDLEDRLGEIGRAALQADDFVMCFRAPEVRMHAEHKITLPGVVSQPTNAETYGATVIREALAAIKDFKTAESQRDFDKPTEIILAITAARQAGMTDVSAALETKLLGKALGGVRPVEILTASVAPLSVSPDRTAAPVLPPASELDRAPKKKGARTPRQIAAVLAAKPLNGAHP
jgi:hypothetical protein